MGPYGYILSTKSAPAPSIDLGSNCGQVTLKLIPVPAYLNEKRTRVIVSSHYIQKAVQSKFIACVTLTSPPPLALAPRTMLLLSGRNV